METLYEITNAETQDIMEVLSYIVIAAELRMSRYSLLEAIKQNFFDNY
jgi:hypothetical protein